MGENSAVCAACVPDALFSIPHMDGDDILQSIKETQRLQKEKHKMLFDARDATFDGMPLNIPINFKAGGE